MSASSDGLSLAGSSKPTSVSTLAGSCAARRPQSKACLLASIATPLSSIARSIASRRIGTRPFCQAAPSMNMLEAIASPRSAAARRWASSTSALSPSALFRRSISPSASTLQFGLRAKSAVGVRSAEMTARVRGLSFETHSSPAATMRSQPISASASPAAIRVAWSALASRAMRTCEVTAPYFWLRPVKSRLELKSPSRWAATASVWLMVTTPEPPMPATSKLKRSPISGRIGSGIGGR